MPSIQSPILDHTPDLGAPRPGSDRAFGLFFAALLAIAAGYGVWRGASWGWPVAAAAALLASVAIALAHVLAPANRLWFALGMALARVVNPVVLAILFFVVVTPMGLLMRVFGQRPLSLSFDRRAKTYWIEREPGALPPESMRDQF